MEASNRIANRLRVTGMVVGQTVDLGEVEDVVTVRNGISDLNDEAAFLL